MSAPTLHVRWYWFSNRPVRRWIDEHNPNQPGTVEWHLWRGDRWMEAVRQLDRQAFICGAIAIGCFAIAALLKLAALLLGGA